MAVLRRMTFRNNTSPMATMDFNPAALKIFGSGGPQGPWEIQIIESHFSGNHVDQEKGGGDIFVDGALSMLISDSLFDGPLGKPYGPSVSMTGGPSDGNLTVMNTVCGWSSLLSLLSLRHEPGVPCCGVCC